MATPKSPRNPDARQEWPQHELVDKLLPDPCQQQSLILLTGFCATSPLEGYVRLFLDHVLGRCVDILKKDVVLTEPMDKSPFRPTAVWVLSDAKLQYRNLTSHEIQARFLGGKIFRENIARAARFSPAIASRLTIPLTHGISCRASNAPTSCSDLCPGRGGGGGEETTILDCFGDDDD